MADEKVIVYHYPCVDGIFSALMAHFHFKDSGKVRYFPLTVYKEHKPEELMLTGVETVYMVDIAGKPGFASALAGICKEVIVLDHHKTAMEDIGSDSNRPPNLKVTFDMGRSGATIARDYFKPDLPDNVAALINMVEDGDLYKWKIPESKAFYAYLQSLTLEYDVNKNPGIFDQLIALDMTAAVSEGARIMKEDSEKIDERLKQMFRISIGGNASMHGTCLAVRGDGLENLRSDMGNILAKQSAAEGLRGVSCVAYIEAAMQDSSKIKLSFRAVGEEDTTTFIKEFGGGGHAKASSCVIPLVDFEAWKCK